jgi:cyclase
VNGDVALGRLVRLGQRSYQIACTPEGSANAGIVVGDSAVLVVDARLTPALGANLRSVALGLGPERLILVNTHHHGDHSFGNAAFVDATIVASDWSAQAMAADWANQVAHFGHIRPAQAREFPEAPSALPTVRLHGSATVDLGGVEVVLERVGRAHTPGDLVVRVPGEDVVFVGDVVFDGLWPIFWDADATGWLEALDHPAIAGARTLVPGHGRAGGPEVVDRMRACLRFLVERATAAADDGLTEAIEASRFRDWRHRDFASEAIARLRGLNHE